jgi:hypothetical protein
LFGLQQRGRNTAQELALRCFERNAQFRVSKVKPFTLALTPAPSPAERENHLPVLEQNSIDGFDIVQTIGDCNKRNQRFHKGAPRSPSPGGEGRGEGESCSQFSTPSKLARNQKIAAHVPVGYAAADLFV